MLEMSEYVIMKIENKKRRKLFLVGSVSYHPLIRGIDED